MELKPLADLLKEQAYFDFYREGKLYYKTDSGFRFTVPVEDTGTGTYLAQDKAIVFMRWLRPQYQEVKANAA